MTQGIVGILGSILGNGTLGTLGRMGMQIGAGTVLLKYSRGDETEADAVGAIIMYNAGYDPRALADYFEKLGQGGKGGPQFLSDHPNPGNRSAAIEMEASGWPPRKYRQNSPDFTEARQYASRTRVYTAQEIAEGARQGMWARENIRAGATPASVRRSIEHNQGETIRTRCSCFYDNECPIQ